jgi:hypothetical protein
MNSNDNQIEAYNLDWDLNHLGDDEFDAQLVKFSGYENIVRLASPKRYSLPEKVFFEANFRKLESTDFPYNDVNWPIMSKRMLDVLLSVGSFPHRVIPVIMVNDTISSEDRYDASGIPKPGVEDYSFVAVQLLERLDVFDWDHSIYSPDDDFPNRAFNIKKLVLKSPGNGFPPLFRISASPIGLFISSKASAALQEANIQGLELVELANIRS